MNNKVAGTKIGRSGTLSTPFVLHFVTLSLIQTPLRIFARWLPESKQKVRFHPPSINKQAGQNPARLCLNPFKDLAVWITCLWTACCWSKAARWWKS
jgi:hypothetical protein